MKLLEMVYDYYYYPEVITCIKEFVEYANKNYRSFVELTHFETENCVFSYLIKEDITQVYINFAKINKISEVEATVLCRSDYESRWVRVIEKKCVGCIHSEEELEEDNLEGHKGRISLDGKCTWYQKKAE